MTSHRSLHRLPLFALLSLFASAVMLAATQTAAAGDSTAPCKPAAAYDPPYGYCTNAPGFGASGTGAVQIQLTGSFVIRATDAAVSVVAGYQSTVEIVGEEHDASDDQADPFGPRRPLIYGTHLWIDGQCIGGCTVRIWAKSWAGSVAGYGWAAFRGAAGVRTTVNEKLLMSAAGGIPATSGESLWFGGDVGLGWLLETNHGFVEIEAARAYELAHVSKSARQRANRLVGVVNGLRARYTLPPD